MHIWVCMLSCSVLLLPGFGTIFCCVEVCTFTCLCLNILIYLANVYIFKDWHCIALYFSVLIYLAQPVLGLWERVDMYNANCHISDSLIKT